MSLEWHLVIFSAALLIGLSKGGLGGPLPVALVSPLVALVMPISEAIGIIVPLLIFADMFAIRAYWKEWDMAQIRLLMPFAIIGTIIGIIGLRAFAPFDTALRLFLGVFTLGVVIYWIMGNRKKAKSKQENNTPIAEYQFKPWHAYLAGFGSGFMSALANTGAPVITSYLILQQFERIKFIGTITLLFSVVNFMKLPGHLSAGTIQLEQLLSVLWALPVIPIAVWLGRQLIEKMSQRVFDIILIALLLWAASTLIITALT